MRTKPWNCTTKAALSRAVRAGFLVLSFLSSEIAVWSDPKILEPGTGQGPSLRAALEFGSQAGVSSTIRLEGGLGFFIFGLAIDGEGAVIRGGLSFGPYICGPGRLAGPASFLSSPVSLSATSLKGASFRLDTGLASSLSLLALGLGDVTAFAVCRNGNKGFIAEASGLAAGATAPGEAGFTLVPQPIPGDSGCATGLVMHMKTGGGDLAFITAASRSGPPESDGSWRLEAAPDPGGLGLVAGLAYEARGQDWRSAFGFEYSWGPLRGGGSAARLECATLLSPLRLSLSAGYAASEFRDCLGESEDRGAMLALGCGLPLWDGASFRVSCCMVCPSFGTIWPGGIALCDLIGRTVALDLSMGSGEANSGAGSLRLKPGFSFGLDVDGSAFLSPGFGLSGKAGTAVWNLGTTGRWVEASGEAGGCPTFKASFQAATPSSAALALEAGHCISWKPGSRPILDASLGVSLAAFGNGRLAFVVEWRKFVLGIAGSGEDGSPPALRIRYSMAQ